MMTETEELPVLTGTMHTWRGVTTVEVSCPRCGEVHTHGWPSAAPGIEHRVAHCVAVGGRSGYYVRVDAV